MGRKGGIAAGAIVFALLSGCSAQPATEDAKVVEYHFDYPVYDNAEQIIGTADVIVRGTAVASRAEWLYPETSTETDPLLNPQAGLSAGEIAQWREDAAVAVTVSTLEVTEVLKGEVAVGERVEVSQVGGTLDGVTYTEQHTTVLPSDGSEFVLLLADHGAGKPFDLLNPEQALYGANGSAPLEAVAEDAPLDNETTGDIRAEVAAQK
ncbi:hypothetical protein [Actinoplanes couchii]|uniref:Lipoprotein n=1 Tax=Actinoplanes couchii TaxID=403638 RepID=A0ABQ3X515_9ACTN|nr:hypothetical protein [Actinoplanes couchii]MDR6326071.1 hypothetical protein [Actinoplanes couchii]GID53576.1 hypothetical protein Aco03nite_019800 [Actinoplanes couchii]